MKNLLKFAFLFLLGLSAQTVMAQIPEDVVTESGDPGSSETGDAVDPDAPIDDVVERTLINQRRVMPYDQPREIDILYSKYVWRVIDVREKMNQPFMYDENPLIKILMDAAQKGDITVYSVEDDKFRHKLNTDEVSQIGASIDTVVIFDPETYEEKITVVRNELNPEDIKRFRVKELWWFDRETSQMRVRILGIAPLYEKKDDNGQVQYENPLFWVYYPRCRELLSRNQVFNENNVATPMSWQDLFEARIFSSYIFKASNVHNQRLQDYLSGTDLLMEGEKNQARDIQLGA
jgi:gliding motility associated protien GldN